MDLDQRDHAGIPTHTAFTAAGTGGELYNTGEISYADDLVSTAASLSSLQRKADILSAFTVLFDMELSPAKLRLAVFGPAPAANPAIPIHGSHLSPSWVPLRSHSTVKTLGVTFDTGGPQTTQKAATKLRLARACTTMCAQRRLDSAVIAASVSTLTRASYTAQFTPWTAQDLPALNVPLNKLFRRLSGNMATFPTQLLYLPPSTGGLGPPLTSTHVSGAWPKGRSPTMTTRLRRFMGCWTGPLGTAGIQWHPANPLESAQPRAHPHGVAA